MQHLYHGVTWRRRDTNVVYLTFDDGPIPEVTPAVLDILKEQHVRATFFMVGDNILKYPDLYARVVTEGHRVGNHTMHHTKGTRVSTAAYLADVEACGHVMPANEPRLFRPPYGKMSFRQKQALLEHGYEIILWDVLTHDYNRQYSPEKMLRIIEHYTRPGSIINFHDSLKSGERALAVLPQAIRAIREKGYSFGTL